MATKPIVKPTLKTGKGVVATRASAAETFGVALTTVDAWVRAGCPVQQRGSRGVEWQLNTYDLHTWLVDKRVAQATGEKATDADGLTLRKLAAQTEMAELELAKAKGEVVELPMVERALANAFATLQVRLRAIPGRVVSGVLGNTDESKVKEIVLLEIDQALEALSSLDLTGEDLDGDEDEDA